MSPWRELLDAVIACAVFGLAFAGLISYAKRRSRQSR